MITRENAKELLPIIKAYSEGKEIEFQELGGNWELLTYPNFDGEPCHYRIKPEPKYRPFKSIEECWGEMQKHQPFGWLKKIKGTESYFPLAVDSQINFEFRFTNYLFADGTPFGIKEKE